MKRTINRWRTRFLAPLLEQQKRLLEQEARHSDEVKTLLGGLLTRSSMDSIRTLGDAEFRVFSQFGEDGIIQFLIDRVPIDREVFVEIGVENYSESNTRFLLTNNNWVGYIIDRSPDHLDFLQRTHLAWRHSISALCAHVTRENINQILEEAGAEGDIGLFSIDIDGNDFWILDALSISSPRIVVAEYNSLFGPNAAIVVPYDPSFNRTQAHYSGLYGGASLAALNDLLTRRGYRLIGSNTAGNNAFFVRDDLAGRLPSPTVKEAYVQSRLREGRDPEGRLAYLDAPTEGLDLIADLPVWDVREQAPRTVGESLLGVQE